MAVKKLCFIFNSAFLLVVFAERILEHSVKCDPKQMHVFFEFEEDFEGLIYAKNYFNSEECRSYGNNSKRISLSLPLNIDVVRKPYCGVQLNKKSHEFSVTLLVNGAKDILVSGLQVFQVVCLYHLQDVTVQLHSLGGIHIGNSNDDFQHDEPTVIRGDGTGVLPILDMAIREGRGIEGSRLQNGYIGQDMTLDVFLDDAVPYDIFVYNCIAHDGTRWPSGTVTLIDRNGCGMPVDRVTQLPVESALDDRGIKHVYLGLRGFQFSTSEVVYFECQVKPCLHKCNITQCQVIKPGTGLLTTTTQKTKTEESSEKLTKLRESNSLDSFSLQTKLSMRFSDPTIERWMTTGGPRLPPTLVRRSESDEVILGSTSFQNQQEPNDSPENSLCLPKPAMGVTVSVLVLASVFCIAATGVIWFKIRSSQTDDKDESRA